MNIFTNIFKSKKSTKEVTEDVESFQNLTKEPSFGTKKKKVFDLFDSNFISEDLDPNGLFKKEEIQDLDKTYTGYFVNFESVFHVKEMREGFMKHLEFEHNTEFLLEIDSLSKENIFIITKNDLKIFHSIINKFIKVRAPKELNISGKIRKQVLDVAIDNEKEWVCDQTPLEVLEPVRSEIHNNLFTEAFPRFYYSDFGYEIISKNAKNPFILSKNPMYAVLYKMKETLGDIDVKQKNYNNIALDLSNSDRFLVTYFDLEKELKNLPVKLMLMESGRHSRINLKKVGIEHFESNQLKYGRGNEHDLYFMCLIIGDIVFIWNETHLCIRKILIFNFIAKKIVSEYDIINSDGIIVGNTRDINLKEFSHLLYKWNIGTKYSLKKSKNDRIIFRNSQDFVDDLLDFMEIKIESECLKLFLNRIKEKGNVDLRINFNLDFQKKFKLKSNEYHFNDHKTLDEFLEKLFQIDSQLEKNHKNEYDLLKCFDRFFWSKYNYITSNFTKTESLYEEIVKERIDLLFELHEDDYDSTEWKTLNQKYVQLKQEFEYFKNERLNTTPLRKENRIMCPLNEPK